MKTAQTLGLNRMSLMKLGLFPNLEKPTREMDSKNSLGKRDKQRIFFILIFIFSITAGLQCCAGRRCGSEGKCCGHSSSQIISLWLLKT